MRDYVREDGLVQFKIMVWDQELPNVLSEVSPNIIVKLSDKKNTDLLDEVILGEKDLDLILYSVFTNFDKYGDGYLNLNEIETVCRELGLDVTHSDFQGTLASLDENHDNKISFEEFSNWYKNGRQCSKLIENLITMRIATSTFMNNVINSPYLFFMTKLII